MLGDELCAANRSSAFTTEVGLGHQTAQPAPTDARADPRALPSGQYRDPRVSETAVCTAPGWVNTPPLGPMPCNNSGLPRAHGQIHPKHRSNAGLVAGLYETHRAIE